MEIFKASDMIGGWFIGDFTPAAFNTTQFEVAYKQHKAGEKWDTHYHEYITEVNYMIEGRMLLQGTEICTGDIFILKPYEVADPIFLENCKMIVVKTPSVVDDKVIV